MHTYTLEGQHLKGVLLHLAEFGIALYRFSRGWGLIWGFICIDGKSFAFSFEITAPSCEGKEFQIVSSMLVRIQWPTRSMKRQWSRLVRRLSGVFGNFRFGFPARFLQPADICGAIVHVTEEMLFHVPLLL